MLKAACPYRDADAPCAYTFEGADRADVARQVRAHLGRFHDVTESARDAAAAFTPKQVRRLIADAYRDGLRDDAAGRPQHPGRVADLILTEHALGEA